MSVSPGVPNLHKPEAFQKRYAGLTNGAVSRRQRLDVARAEYHFVVERINPDNGS